MGTDKPGVGGTPLAGDGQGPKAKQSRGEPARAREAGMVQADNEECVRRARLVDPTIVAARRACIRGLVLAGRTVRGQLAPVLATVWTGLKTTTIEGDIGEVMRSIAEQDPDAVKNALHDGLTEVLAGAKAARKLVDDALGDGGFVQLTTPRDLKEASEAMKNGWDTTIRALELLGKTHGVLQASQVVSVSFKLEVGGSKLELTKGQIGNALQMVTESYDVALGELLSPEVAARVKARAGDEMARRSAEDVT